MEAKESLEVNGQTGTTTENDDYRETIRTIIDNEVQKAVNAEIQRAAQELIEEHKKATQQIMDEYRSIIHEIVEEEKRSIGEKAEQLRRSILKIGN